MSSHRTRPRLLHPVAWWIWGVGLAVAASRTTNPVLLLLVLLVAGIVVAERRELGAANPLVAFLALGLVAIGIRLTMVALLGSDVPGGTVLLTLPEAPLPSASGVRLGGPVTLEGLVAASYDGLRLAVMLTVLGATNALASPRRLLRHLPATLYEIGTAVVVALTFAPQLVDDARRVRAARRLRGRSGRGPRELGRLVVPVLTGALDRSLALAASMESRGYGRAVRRTRGAVRLAGVLTLVGVSGVVVGLYGLLDATSPPALGAPLVVLGAGCAAAALVVGARHEDRSRHRQSTWGPPEWLTAVSGVVPLAVLVVGTARGWAGLTPAPDGLPAVPLAAVVALLVAVLPAVLTPLPPRLAAHRAASGRRAGEAVAA